MKVRAIDQETVHSGGAHFAKHGLPRAGHAPPFEASSQGLGKAVISAMSRIVGVRWWAVTGSNRRPAACKAAALPLS
jgi:hypothetical protein